MRVGNHMLRQLFIFTSAGKRPDKMADLCPDSVDSIRICDPEQEFSSLWNTPNCSKCLGHIPSFLIYL
ncbi:unnamed protein product [Gadus morhua 'NCC']